MPCRGRFLRDSQDVPDAVALGGTSATVRARLHRRRRDQWRPPASFFLPIAICN